MSTESDIAAARAQWRVGARVPAGSSPAFTAEWLRLTTAHALGGADDALAVAAHPSSKNPHAFAKACWVHPSRRAEPGFQGPSGDWHPEALAHWQWLESEFERLKGTPQEPGAPNGIFHGPCNRCVGPRDGHGHCWCCGERTFDSKNGGACSNGCLSDGGVHVEGQCRAETCPRRGGAR